MAKLPLGKLKPTAIGMTELPRLDARILGGFRELGDLTGTTSDALDDCGISGAVPASLLKPTDPAARVVGQAITVLNRKVGEMRKVSGLADIEAHNLAEGGDVLVVQGVAGIEVKPGDLVIADECGVCFVPFARAAEVLAVAQRLAASEAQRLKKLAEGIPLAEFVKLPR